jgi:hypothetical protein
MGKNHRISHTIDPLQSNDSAPLTALVFTVAGIVVEKAETAENSKAKTIVERNMLLLLLYGLGLFR